MDTCNSANYLIRITESLKYLETDSLCQYYEMALNLAYIVFIVTSMSSDIISPSDYKHLSLIIKHWIEKFHNEEHFLMDIEKILLCGKKKIQYFTFAEQLYNKVGICFKIKIK